MTASREIQNPRQHRSSMNLTPSSMPTRNSYSSKPFSTSVTLGATNSANRVSRRKSSNVNGMSMATITAIRNQASQGLLSESARLSGPTDRRSPTSSNDVAVEDGPMLGKIPKGRGRRASDAPRLTKERTKSNAGGELKCETCGKGYKHGSCLTKHLWEHTPEWQVTSKLLISKHQQVQLLEAASVLMGMGKDGPLVSGVAVEDSDNSSASPAASGSSDAIEYESDDDRSSRTSTPEHVEHAKPSMLGQRMRSDSYNSAFVGSYQSTLATSLNASSMPTYGGYAMGRQWSSGSRPSTSQGQSDDETADLNAAARGLQLIGTPQVMPTLMESDIPPVPELPAQYRNTRKYSNVRDSRHSLDVDMEDDDEGVFGMES